MTAAQLDERLKAHAKQVRQWRLEQFLAAGYDLPDARRLARCQDVDLHQAVDLVRAGCPPELAVLILR
jgi:hypothetical protein